MRKYGLALIALLLCLGFSFAEEASAKGSGKALKPSAEKSAKPETAPGKTGIVTAIDKNAGSFSIKRDGDEKPFTFECADELVKEIKVGDKVNIWYDRSGEKRIATYVEKIGKSDTAEKPAADNKKKKKEAETK